MSDTVPSFADALVASGPTDKYPTRMNRFGRLVGRWNVTSRRLDEATGEWRETDFVWVVAFILDGRAVQDVSLRAVEGGYETIGTAVRVYDPSMGAWRVSYVEPGRGEYCQLVATSYRSDGIRQDGTRNDGMLIRWNFSAITEESYTWESFVSHDEGKTWELNEHNDGVRID